MRADIVPTRQEGLAEQLERTAAAFRSNVGRDLRPGRARADKRFAMRADLLEPPSSDPNGFERIIGESDLMSINFLDRGKRAAAAVCRIEVPSSGGAWHGTGFLVGPRLLVTNHHVLGNADEASQAEVQFGYEHDIDGVLQPPVAFNLRPHELFYTDAALDVTFVALAPLASNGAPVERYGWLPLLPLSGKAVDGEWVTIIQHPGGQPKQIAIRSSQIVLLDQASVPRVNLDDFIHYVTDTEPGSSGAPVLNDQWQVLAVHHKAVPRLAPGEAVSETTQWIANEGIRVSALFRHLETHRFTRPAAGMVLDRLDRGLGLAPLRASATRADDALEADRRPLPLDHWAGVSGYDAGFLSEPIAFDAICAPLVAAGRVAPLLDGSGHALAYRHFSCAIHAERKFALLTAVNIDGDRLVNPGPRSNGWRRDARIADEYQPAGNFYERSQGADPVQFSRGHQVRRLDPCWGSPAEAQAAEGDTFHYTNAAPQVQRYNDSDWGDLEDYLLDRAQVTMKRLTVFTGPIFRDDDPLYGEDREGGPWRIPLSFWKVAVLQKAPGIVAAAAFIIGQTQYVQALYEAKVFSGLKPYTIDELRERRIQTTIAAIEQETGLDFSAIRAFDAQGSLEATRRTRWIDDVRDVMI